VRAVRVGENGRATRTDGESGLRTRPGGGAEQRREEEAGPERWRRSTASAVLAISASRSSVTMSSSSSPMRAAISLRAGRYRGEAVLTSIPSISGSGTALWSGPGRRPLTPSFSQSSGRPSSSATFAAA
jgi:hypothetical protein